MIPKKPPPRKSKYSRTPAKFKRPGKGKGKPPPVPHEEPAPAVVFEQPAVIQYPRVLLATLCLNEREHLGRLYRQHCRWPGLIAWVFVESADRVYAETSPHLVSSDGLSTDGSSEILAALAMIDSRVHHVRHGFSTHEHPAQGKVQSRQRYLDIAAELRPDFVFVLDADEYYTADAQEKISRLLGRDHAPKAFMFPQRHIWRPPSIADQPLFAHEVIGGYWRVPHCRGWRWEEGLRYHKNHNWPEDLQGRYLNTESTLRRLDMAPVAECVHLGYASSIVSRQAKHRYYVARGEGQNNDQRRRMYVECREAYEQWRPGEPLPHGAQVVAYRGPIPEVLQDAQ